MTQIDLQPDTPLAVRPREAAKLLSISTRTLYEWTLRGVVPCVRVGPRCVLYPVEELRAWLRKRAERSTEAER